MIPNDLPKGTKIRCIDNYGCTEHLTLQGVYTVDRILDGTHVRLEPIPGHYFSSGGYYLKRFEVADTIDIIQSTDTLLLL